MTQYDNTNRGVLFDNDRKETDSHPDMTGTLNIDGVEHWFSAWWKDSDSKGEYLSLSIGKPKEPRREQSRQREPEQPQRRGNQPSNSAPQQQRREPERRQAAPQQRASSGFDDMDDDIPFISNAFAWDATTSKQRRMSRYDY